MSDEQKAVGIAVIAGLLFWVAVGAVIYAVVW